MLLLNKLEFPQYFDVDKLHFPYHLWYYQQYTKAHIFHHWLKFDNHSYVEPPLDQFLLQEEVTLQNNLQHHIPSSSCKVQQIFLYSKSFDRSNKQEYYKKHSRLLKMASSPFPYCRRVRCLAHSNILRDS